MGSKWKLKPYSLGNKESTRNTLASYARGITAQSKTARYIEISQVVKCLFLERKKY